MVQIFFFFFFKNPATLVYIYISGIAAGGTLSKTLHSTLPFEPKITLSILSLHFHNICDFLTCTQTHKHLSCMVRSGGNSKKIQLAVYQTNFKTGTLVIRNV